MALLVSSSRPRSLSLVQGWLSHVETLRKGPTGFRNGCPRLVASSSWLNMIRWREGERVLVPTDTDLVSRLEEPVQKSGNGRGEQGTIVEHRGSGWYSVKLQDGSLMKCRGTRLRRLMEGEQGSFHNNQNDNNDTQTNTLGSATTITNPLNPWPLATSSIRIPPPPTVIDLDAAVELAQRSDDSLDPVQRIRDQEFLEQVAHHRSFRRWVVFTDLHCAPATLETTLEVLDTVHRLAVEREAGVLFLGDWWHHRGTLRVDCLNAVLARLKNWTVPMVLIPGNHDQVTLGGLDHALTPLENAYRVSCKSQEDDGDGSTRPAAKQTGPLVFSQPTVFGGALFVPHIRNAATLESVLQSPQALQATAVFVHADVTGASMNDNLISYGGVPPSIFPPNRPIYSGHFHKPHVVRAPESNVEIEYLGSPYQISLAEAQQEKALVMLDADRGWTCVERIPLRVGRCHFRIHSVPEFLNLTLSSSSEAKVGSQVSEMPAAESACPGDRIVLSLTRDELESMRHSQGGEDDDSDITTRIGTLREAGVSVEIRQAEEERVVKDHNSTRDVEAGENVAPMEDLSPESVWRAYLQEEVRRDAMSNTTAARLLPAGLDLLSSLEADSARDDRTRLELHQVSVEGFGPFRDKVVYPLNDRGLILLRGSNRDGGSADSNGSGKTSLAMSVVWALTGSIDSRPALDGKVTDIIHDGSKSARVSLQGTVNGVEFSISRSKTASKSGLVFFYEGKDQTMQSVKETQARVEEWLGLNSHILSRAMFHGQHGLNQLLEASDTRLKDELSLVVPLGIWHKVLASARKQSRAATQKAAEIGGMLSVREKDLEMSKERLKNSQDGLRDTEAAFERFQRESLPENFDQADDKDIDDLDIAALDTKRRQATDDVIVLEARIEAIRAEREIATEKLSEDANALLAALDRAAKDVEALEREHDRGLLIKEAAAERVRELAAMWGLNLTSGMPNAIKLPKLCPTCHQDLSLPGNTHSHDNTVETVTQEVKVAWVELADAKENLRAISSKLTLAHEAKALAEQKLSQGRDALRDEERRWDEQLSKAEEKAKTLRNTQRLASEEIAALVQRMRKKEALRSYRTNLALEEQKVESARAGMKDVQREVYESEERVNDLRESKQKELEAASLMSDLSDAFGQNGVEAFVLQNAVSWLEAASQSYLDGLSDGDLRLGLSLESGERIARYAQVRGPDGTYKDRSLSALSGGQWRRCALALTLGYIELLAQRGRFHSSLIVMDEPLTHLDQGGRSEVGKVFRNLICRDSEMNQQEPFAFRVSTILLILQDLAAEELEEAFDCIDDVVKRDGVSSVVVDDLG